MTENILVLDLSSVLAGPSVAMFFAELGAKVIKIENPLTNGDVTRSWKLGTEDADSPYSAYYASVNWGKEVRFLDIRTREAQDNIHALVVQADIVVTNFKASSAATMRMDLETLRAINPRLIVAEINGFGDDDENRVAYDVILQAESGFMYMNGEANGNPVKLPVALIDILAAHQLKEGILYALWQRERTGQGAIVRVSLMESALAALANQATNYLIAKHIPQRMGSQHPNIAPYGDCFKTQDDKQLVLAVGNDKQFEALLKCLNITELPNKEHYKTNGLRVKNRIALNTILNEAFAKLSAELILERCHAAQVPIGTLRNMKAVFELPIAQNMILEDELGRRVKTKAFELIS